jgi:hypothetical protein
VQARRRDSQRRVPARLHFYEYIFHSSRPNSSTNLNFHNLPNLKSFQNSALPSTQNGSKSYSLPRTCLCPPQANPRGQNHFLRRSRQSIGLVATSCRRCATEQSICTRGPLPPLYRQHWCKCITIHFFFVCNPYVLCSTGTMTGIEYLFHVSWLRTKTRLLLVLQLWLIYFPVSWRLQG